MTGTICSVASCKSNAETAKKSGEKRSFFRFPKDATLRKEWVRRCYRKGKFDPRNKRICGTHFTSDDFEDGLQAKLMNIMPKRLKKTAIPSLHLLPESENLTQASSSSAMEKCSKTKQLKQKQIVEKLLTPISVDQLANVKIIINAEENSYETLLQKYNYLLLKNVELKKHIQAHEEQLAMANKGRSELQKLVESYENQMSSNVRGILNDIFTPNQLDILLKKKKRARWNEDEISKAFTLRYFSKRAYIYVREKLKYPLPGISTLQKWASNIKLRDGILTDVLKIMDVCGSSKTSRQRITVLSFDEVKVASLYEYDQKGDEVIGEHKYMQVIMARGLFDNWKQPIYIGFDTKMTKQLLEEVITQLDKVQYNVVACVSDCGASNMGLWKELGINVNKTYCIHPVTKEKVYFFADVPHLLKLIRNWFVDTGFCLEDGSRITKDAVQRLIEETNTEISSCHKLTPLHLTCERTQRQNVSLAAQLFSNTTATALRRYNLPGINKETAVAVADFIQSIGQWFDLMNSYVPLASVPPRQPYGKDLEKQNELLENIKNLFTTMRCTNKRTLQIFQKGVIVSCTSLQNLYKSLTLKHPDISYILTHRVNQDCLKNFFSQVRTRDGLHDHPSPLNALYRVRMVLLGKNSGIVQQRTNVPVDESDQYVLSSALKKAVITKFKPPTPPTNVFVVEDEDTASITSSTSSGSAKESAEKDGLMYVAGFLAKKFTEKHTSLGQYTHKAEEEDLKVNMPSYSMPSWLRSLSFGSLTEPSTTWFNTVKNMEKYFCKFHDTGFHQRKNIVKTTSNAIRKKLPDIPSELVTGFVKQRIFIRIKYLNAMKKEKETTKRKATDDLGKSFTKMRKITT